MASVGSTSGPRRRRRSSRCRRPPPSSQRCTTTTCRWPSRWMPLPGGWRCTWGRGCRSRSETATVERHRDLLEGALDAVFASVTATRAGEAPTARTTTGGLVLGIPTNRAPDRTDGAAPIDRLLRALTGTRWRAIVLAQPVTHDVVRALRLRTVNELRSVQTAAKVGGAPSPLAEQYTQLLKAQLASLSEALGSGAWRTAVYLLGDETTYHGLASLWRGLFQGERSLPEPVRVWAHRRALIGGRLGPGRPPRGDERTRPVLAPVPAPDAADLGPACRLRAAPERGDHGFAVTPFPISTPRPRRSRERACTRRGRRAQPGDRPALAVDADQFTRTPSSPASPGRARPTRSSTSSAGRRARHALPRRRAGEDRVPGARGRSRPWLPSCGCSRSATRRCRRLRLNPFEVPSGIPVGVHLDLLRSVF